MCLLTNWHCTVSYVEQVDNRLQVSLPTEWTHFCSDFRVSPPNDRQPSPLPSIIDLFPPTDKQQISEMFIRQTLLIRWKMSTLKSLSRISWNTMKCFSNIPLCYPKLKSFYFPFDLVSSHGGCVTSEFVKQFHLIDDNPFDVKSITKLQLVPIGVFSLGKGIKFVLLEINI